MDYKEEINKAAEIYSKQDTGKNYRDLWIGFIDGAFSNAAKNYWYNEFKAEQSNLFKHHKYIFGTGGMVDNEDWKPYAREPQAFVSDGILEHYDKPELISKNDIDDVVNGKRPHYPYGTIQSDPLYGATKKDFDDATPKRIDIIGHVDHSSSCLGLRVTYSQRIKDIAEMIIKARSEGVNMIFVGGRGGTRKEIDNIIKARSIGITELPPIESIVPIADIIPEPILSKHDFIKMHDKAVERSITDKVYKESHAWDIKKEKKENHKRNNKKRK